MKGGESVLDFEKVFQDNSQFIFRFIMKLCGDKALAEEEKKQEIPQQKTGMEAGEISVGQELQGPNGPSKDDQEVR